MKFPVDDVQFWVGTAAFVGAVWWLVRGVFGGKRKGGAGKRGKGKKVVLTVEGRGVRRGGGGV